MANVKSRPKAHRSAPTKSKVSKAKHASAGHKDAGRIDTKKSNSLRSAVNDKVQVNLLSPNDLSKGRKRRSTKIENKKDVPSLSKGQTNEPPAGNTDTKKINCLKSPQSDKMVYKKRPLPANNSGKHTISSKRPNNNNKIDKDILKVSKYRCKNNIQKLDNNNAKKIKSVFMQEMKMHDILSNHLENRSTNRSSANNVTSLKNFKIPKKGSTNNLRSDIIKSNNSNLTQELVVPDISKMLDKGSDSNNKSNSINKTSKDTFRIPKKGSANNTRSDITKSNNFNSVQTQAILTHVSSNDMDNHITSNDIVNVSNKTSKDIFKIPKERSTNTSNRAKLNDSNSDPCVDISSNEIGTHEVLSNRLRTTKASKDTTTNNSKSIPTETLINSGKDKFADDLSEAVCTINMNTLLSKSGRIKRKNKDHFKILDNILKSELMISDKKTKKHNGSTSNVQNNNDTDITDQNATFNTSPPLNMSGNNKESKTDEKNPDKKKVALTNGRVVTLPVFECNYCGKSFSNKKSICRHIYCHLKIKPYRCKHCSNRFSHRANRDLHTRKRHLEPFLVKNFTCQICSKTYAFRQKLLNHLEVHIRSGNHNKCVFCLQKFPDKTSVAEHEEEHLKSDKYKCSLCDARFDTGKELALHAKYHLKSRGYICQYCGKEFSEIGSLRRHLGVAHTGHRIQCPICKKKLKGHLSEHMRTHEKDRPHECPDCGQRFTQSTQLNVHRRCHTGARPYPCKICKRRFTHSNALMLHTRRHTGEKPFPCAMCPLSFSQLPHMKAHMRNIHGKEKAYKCQKCGQFYKFKVHLENHVKFCTVGDKELSFEEKIQASVEYDEIDSVMDISRMRFLLALLLTMIASQDKLKYLGFNKRLIDDILVECIEAMGQKPCKDESLSQLRRLKTNIEMLLIATIPKEEMVKFRRQNKSTEELLEILTDAKKPCIKMNDAI